MEHLLGIDRNSDTFDDLRSVYEEWSAGIISLPVDLPFFQMRKALAARETLLGASLAAVATVCLSFLIGLAVCLPTYTRTRLARRVCPAPHRTSGCEQHRRPADIVCCCSNLVAVPIFGSCVPVPGAFAACRASDPTYCGFCSFGFSVTLAPPTSLYTYIFPDACLCTSAYPDAHLCTNVISPIYTRTFSPMHVSAHRHTPMRVSVQMSFPPVHVSSVLEVRNQRFLARAETTEATLTLPLHRHLAVLLRFPFSVAIPWKTSLPLLVIRKNFFHFLSFEKISSRSSVSRS